MCGEDVASRYAQHNLTAYRQSFLRIVVGMGWIPLKLRKGIMLVLSRKKNESIVINNDITIVVVEIRGDKVRLGVEAPREVPVHRREVFDAIQRSQNEQDAPSDATGIEE